MHLVYYESLSSLFPGKFCAVINTFVMGPIVPLTVKFRN